MVLPRSQTPQGESVAKPEVLLLIILCLECKYDIKKSMVTSPIRFSKRKSMGGNNLGRWATVETGAHTLDISYQVNIDNIHVCVYITIS